MILNRFVRQQWMVMKSAYSPIPWIKYLFLLSLIMAGVGYFSGVIFFRALGAALLAILIIFYGMLLPGQVLTLMSSKNFMLLPGVRLHIAILLLSFCLFLAIIPAVIFNQSYLSFFLCGSFFIIGSVFLGRIVSFFQMVVFFISALTYEHIASISIFYVAVMAVLMWSAFLFWWLRWKPKRYIKTYASYSYKDIVNSCQSLNDYIGGFFKTAWSGSGDFQYFLLSGKSGSAKQWVFDFIVLCSACSFGAAWVKYFLPLGESSSRYMLPILFSFFAIIGSITVFFSATQNLYKIWLFSNLNRQLLWKYFEHKTLFLFGMAVLMSLICFALIGILMFGVYPDIHLYAYFLLSNFLIISLYFYCGVISYINYGERIMRMGWVNASMLFLLIPFIAVSYLVWNSEGVGKVLWAVGTLATLLLVAAILRAKVIKLWPGISFVRVIR